MKTPEVTLHKTEITLMEVRCTGSVTDSAWEIASLAKEFHCIVVGIIKGVEVSCSPGESRSVVITRYRQFMGKGKKA